MPTILSVNGFRFFFYSNDHLPIHIHIEKGGATAKFNLMPLEFVKSNKFSAKDLKEIRLIIEDNTNFLMEKWNEYFNNN